MEWKIHILISKAAKISIMTQLTLFSFPFLFHVACAGGAHLFSPSPPTTAAAATNTVVFNRRGMHSSECGICCSPNVFRI